jgi:hypothetical protein
VSTISKDNGSQDKNKHPFLSRIASYITYEEIYGSSISLNEIIDLVRLLPLKYWCLTTSTSVLLLEYHEFEEEYQGVILNRLFPKELLKKQIRTDGGKRVFFHRTQLLALLRLALLYADTEKIKSVEDDEARKDITTRCLLGISSLIHEKQAAEYGPDFDINLLMKKLTFNFRMQLTRTEQVYLMDFFTVSYHGMHENFNHLIGRYKDMLLDIPNDTGFNPEGVSKDIFTNALIKSTGLTVEEYAALAFGILAYYFPESNLLKSFKNFPIDRKTYFSKTSLRDKDFIASLFDTLSLLVSDFREANIHEGDKQESMLNFKTFMLKPLISLEDSSNLYPCSIRYLQRLLSLEDALSWIAAGNEHSDALRSYIGQVFEFYCRKICERIQSNASIKPKFFPETVYGPVHSRRKTCDAILVYGNAAVLMEFKIKRLKLQRTIIDCDFDSLIEDINMAFIESNEEDKAAKQIDETIKALRNGNLNLSGIDTRTITNYYPIIVTFQNWPLGLFVYDLIRRMVNMSGLLRQSYCAPVEIWSCEELEYIEAILTNDKISPLDIPSIIRDKLNSGYGNMNMYSFLWDKRRDILKNNKYVTGKMDEMLEVIKSQLGLSE